MTERVITLTKHFRGRIGRRFTALVLSCALVLTCIPFAGAITKSEINEMKDQQSQLQDEIDSLEGSIKALKAKENSALEQIELYQQQMDLLATQISDSQDLIAGLETQIAQTQVELEEAQAKATQYYQLFCERVRDLEETGSLSYWSILFDAASFSDLLDRINFISDVVSYDNNMVDALEAARQEVADYEAQLQDEKTAQEDALAELERQKTEIDAATARTEELLEEIAANQETYADQLSALEDDAAELAADLVDAQAEYDAQQRAAAAAAAAAANANKNNNTGSTGGGSSSNAPAANITGSGLGVDIATYACQFVGVLPYVWGGTSLTSGADCSGFVQAVFRQFGIYLPRTSHEQARSGYAVSYSEAQPGDLIFYYSGSSASGGHIGIYIGDGMYVNAVGAKYGTRISYVNTGKSGLTFRRVI